MFHILRRDREIVILVLTLAVCVLAALNLGKQGFLDVGYLARVKDAAATMNSIVSMTLLVIASFYAYYRFFRGRTFSERAEVTVQVTVHDTPEEINLHAINVGIKNLGTSPIWKPKVSVTVKTHGAAEYERKFKIEKWWNSTVENNEADSISIIDIAETSTCHNMIHIAKCVWAVTYFVTVISETGELWEGCLTVSNKAA
jgi:hypothetical protein